MKSLWKIVDGTLVPATEEGQKWLANVSRNREYAEVETKGIRSPEQHKFFFGPVLKKFWDNLSDENHRYYGDIKGLREDILIKLGYCRYRRDGFPRPTSMNWGNMPDEEFQGFLKAFEKHLAEELGVTLDELIGAADA